MDLIQLKHSPQLDTFLSQKITIPRYRPSLTFKISEKLYAAANGFEGYRLSQKDTSTLSELLASELEGCKPNTFIGILQYFTQHSLSKPFLTFLCDQIASSRYTIRKGTPFDLFRGAQGFEWAPFKVTDVLQDVNSHQQHMLCKFIDGRPCGLTFDLKQKAIGYKFYKCAGLPKKSLRGVKLDPKDVVGFKYTALLQYTPFFPLDFTNKNIKRLDTYGISAVRCTASQIQDNKTLHKERLTPCPLKLQTPCAQCFIGYDHCPRGCRTLTNWAVTNTPPAEIPIYVKRSR